MPKPPVARRLIKMDLDEISLCPTPANSGARVLLAKSGEEPDMDVAERIAKLEAENAALSAVLKMTPEEKREYDALTDDDEREAFLADPKKRSKKKAAPVTKTNETTEGGITKADVETLIAKATADLVAKAAEMEAAAKREAERADRLEKAAKASDDARRLTDARARVAKDFGTLPGEPLAKANALLALEGLEPADRSVIEDMLKSGEAALAQAMAPVGKSGSNAGGSAEAELDRLTRERMDGIAKSGGAMKSYHAVYNEILASNPQLYDRSEAEKAARGAGR